MMTSISTIWPSWLLLALLLLASGAAEAAQIRQTSASSCDCADEGQNALLTDMAAFGFTGLLQDGVDISKSLTKRPRDCTCINGMKTYQTTPKDRLLAMGVLTLSRHLASCEQKLDGLEQERDYAVAESEVKVKKATEQTSQAKKLLANIKNATATDRTQSRGEKTQLMKEIGDLEKEVTSLNTKYNAEFQVWWDLKYAMTDQLAKTTKCQCKEKVLLVQRSSRDHMDPAQTHKYDTVRKVEECETKVIKISKEIAKAEETGRKVTIRAIDDRDRLGKSMADQQHLGKVLNLRPQIKMLENTKLHLKTLVKSRKEKVDKYKKTNEDIRTHLKSLEDHLNKCGCF